MLSPLDLENKRIVTKKRKYDKAEMDEYLELVFENYKALYDENEELRKQVKTLSDGVQYYRSMESTMQKALVLAEKTSKETKDAAILKAEAIEKDATEKAEQIINEAEQKYATLKDRCFALIQQFNNYKLQLTQVATEQLELVTSESFDVHSPEFENLQSEQNDTDNTVDIEISATEETTNVFSEPTIETTSFEGFSYEEDSATLDTNDDLDKTTEIPSLKTEDAILSSVDTKTEEETISILTADTIDLRDSIQKVKEEEAKNQIVEPKEAETKTVQEASFVTPVEPVYTTATPLEVELKETKSSNVNTEVLEPAKNTTKEAPTLDSLLQSMNMSSKKNNTKGQDEDPFEFLGSVDDF